MPRLPASGGSSSGLGRRRQADLAARAALLALERDRANLEHDRAALLAERNRLAREVHDVLAHTLGALSVQSEALDAQLDALTEVPSSIREGVKRTRSLASEGLAEARRAVQALRDDAPPLVTQLERLTRATGTTFEVFGDPVPLQSEPTLALYRVAQEAINQCDEARPRSTRAGSRRVRTRGRRALRGERSFGHAIRDLASSGAGYGLDGITERLRLVGGDVTAGPTQSGWRVDAKLPR